MILYFYREIKITQNILQKVNLHIHLVLMCLISTTNYIIKYEHKSCTQHELSHCDGMKIETRLYIMGVHTVRIWLVYYSNLNQTKSNRFQKFCTQSHLIIWKNQTKPNLTKKYRIGLSDIKFSKQKRRFRNKL